MKPGDAVVFDFHGYKGAKRPGELVAQGEGTLDRIVGLCYYVRPKVPIRSYSLLKIGAVEEAPWPFVVVMEDQLRAV
jgi:FAD/FMN-containing dehydrogenase